MLTFEVLGEPVGKERPRKGVNRYFYTPARTKAYEQHVALSALAEINAVKGEKPFIPSGPVTIEIHVHTPKTTPDLDNVLKSVIDGLNGIAYRDDSQVVYILARRMHSQQPRVKVWVGEEA
jgi:Holliday junction resolvase RusA-like endonuclease